MKPARKIFTDPAFYALLLLNVYFIYEYKDDPGKYTAIIWIFWCQSVFIGIFNFIDLFTTKNAKANSFKINDRPAAPAQSRGCYSFFFLFHYEAFHIAYFIFLLVHLNIKNIDFRFLKLALLLLVANMIISFIKQKMDYKKYPPNLSTMFFLPYLRIVPMHFMILLPAFLGWQPSLVFLVLKALFDVIGYLITTAGIGQTKRQNRKKALSNLAFTNTSFLRFRTYSNGTNSLFKKHSKDSIRH